METTTVFEKRSKSQLRLIQFAIAVLAICVLALGTACSGSGNGSGSGGNEVTAEQRTDAKQVVMAASDMFTIMDLGLTDADSPVTISQSDPTYAEFFDALLVYKKVADIEVSDISITASIQAVEASTAREDVQTNYRFTVTDVTMTLNGEQISYSSSSGFTKA